MCGIFAYIGHRNNAASLVLEGLKLLEYRGYDSWGIAIKTGTKISIDKHTGKIGQAQTNLPGSTIGIGHTRWATHGGVTVENAHPHLDCKKQIAVLHNGIIENYAELKAGLINKGHKFLSQTDTEVFAHIVEEELKNNGFASSVRNAFNKLSGLNAIVVMNTASSEVIAVKNGSPLVVGEKEGEYFLASDTTGIVPHTRSILFLKDNEMVIIGNGYLQLLSLPAGKKLEPVFEKIDWKQEAVQKGEYEHFMLKEIHEQPAVIETILGNEDHVKSLAQVIKKAHGTFFIAAGTAYNACMAGVYLFSRVAKVHVNSALASEFNYLEDFLTSRSLVIALSQSGETIDVVEPLTAAQKKGATIVGVVNALGSTIYRMADHKFLLGAGPEKAVASTKAYIAKVTFLLLLAYTIAEKQKTIRPLISAAEKDIARLLKEKERIRKLASSLKNSKNIYVIGRGASYSSALEAALKIKEVSYIPTEGLAGGELKHGTIALIEKNTPCIVFAPNDETYEAMISNATEIKARGGKIIGVSFRDSSVFDEWIEVKDSGDATLLSQIVPIQLLAYYLAVMRGNDPDMPRNLAKSVTVK